MKRVNVNVSGATFYLNPITRWKPSFDTWFSIQLVGVNKLGSMAATLAKKAVFTGRLTNHAGIFLGHNIAYSFINVTFN